MPQKKKATLSPHNSLLAAELFGSPLLIDPAKLEALIKVLGPKFGVVGGSVIEGQEIDLSTVEPGQINMLGASPRSSHKSYQVIEGVAVIPVVGTLLHRGGWMDSVSGLTTYSQINRQLDEALDDADVEAFLFDIDSPGGQVNGAFDLADAIYNARSQKTIWSAVNENAFSAAYLIASSAERVFVPRTGGVGSIGVIAIHADQSAFDEKAGFKFTSIYAGKKKNDLNPHQPISEQATTELTTRINDFYSLFVSTVARNRGLQESSVRGTEAGIYIGSNGLGLGLADEVNSAEFVLTKLVQQIQTGNNGPKHSMESNMPEENAEQEKEKMEDKQKTVDINSARSEGEAKAMAYAKEVTELCSLAGFPSQASQFLTASTPIPEVRASLQKMKANQSEDQDVENTLSGAGKTGDEAINLEDSPLVKACAKIGEDMKSQHR